MGYVQIVYWCPALQSVNSLWWTYALRGTLEANVKGHGGNSSDWAIINPFYWTPESETKPLLHSGLGLNFGAISQSLAEGKLGGELGKF